MRWARPSRTEAAGGLLAALLLLGPLPAAGIPLQCEELVVDGYKFNIGELKGPHTITTSEFHPPTYTNTTYTLDLCAFLERKGDVAKGNECPNNTRVCAIRHLIDPRNDPKDGKVIEAVIPIAGSLQDHGGNAFDWEAQRLRTSDSVSDSKKEGVRLVLKGGVYEKREQKAVIELICDKDRTGKEGEWESKDKYKKRSGLTRNEDEKPDDGKKDGSSGGGGEGDVQEGYPERQLKKDDTALIWEGYGRQAGDSDVDVLQLTWYTKYACEAATVIDTPSSGQWGFFTWLVILLFLATAAYLIFGSWLNYNRYGARGWDLLPHGDTLRDLPYLLKDWLRRFLNTIQGSGSRGGYSAV